MFGIPMEVITMFISTIGGAYIRMKADAQADLAAERQYRAGRQDAARAMQNPNAAWMRRFIVIALFGIVYLAMFAPLLDLPTVVPVEVSEGWRFLFFEVINDTTKYIKLEGVVIQEWLPHSMMAVIGFYFGSAGAKR